MRSLSRAKVRRGVALLVLAASAAALSGCASPATKSMSGKKRPKEYFAESIFGVKASPRVSWKKTNLPRGGGRDQVGKPYVVRGKWYYPKEEKDYRKVGGASWYGDAFHGRLTANGEIYDMTHLTGAHPTMPLPSYARVTNLANGSSVIIRVNDRGPYSDGRIIDLSRRAAEMLDYQHAGVANVKVEYVGRAPLDGRDEKFLMASYRPGGGAPDPSDGLPTGVMIAMNGPKPTDAPRLPTPFPEKKPVLELPTVAAAQGVDLPAFGPIAPARPDGDGGSQIAFAAMSYAAGEPSGASGAFSVFDRKAAGASFIAAGTFSNAAAAQALAASLGAFGKTSVERQGPKAYAVTLRPDGRMDADALIEAAWANGAPDAMTVRE